MRNMPNIGVLLLFIGGALASLHSSAHQNEHSNPDREIMLKTNRFPKRPFERQGSTIDMCNECKFAVQEIAAYLNNPANVDKLKGFIMQYVCSEIGPAQGVCDLLTEDLEGLVQFILPYLQNTDKACQEISLCPSSTAERLTIGQKFAFLVVRHVAKRQRATASSSSAICEECKFAVMELKTVLEDQSIQNEIKDWLHDACKSAGQFEQECDNLIDQYLPGIMQEVANLLNNPEALCEDVGLCPHTQLMRKIMRQRSYSSAFSRLSARHRHELKSFVKIGSSLRTRSGIAGTCVACTMAVDVFWQFLKYSNETQLDIVRYVEKICNAFPSDIKAQCLDFLDVYGQAALVLTLNEFNGKEVCVALKACNNVDARLYDQDVSQGFDPKCDACWAAFEFLQMELKSPQFQEALISFLQNLCQLINHEYELQCKESITELVQQLALKADTFLAPSVACPQLGMCKTTQNQ